MKKSRLKKITAGMLAGILLLLCSCSGKSGTQTGGEGTGSKNPDMPEESVMGRYLEEEVPLSEDMRFMLESMPNVGEIGTLQILDNGDLAIFDSSMGLYTSPDHGKTWEKRENSALDEFLMSGLSYVPDQVIAPDGSIAMIYSGGDSSEEEQEGGYHPKYYYMDGEGIERPVAFSGSEDFLNKLAFGKDSRLYAFSIKGVAYVVSREDGIVRQLFETDGVVDYVCFTDTYMVLFTSRGIMLYNLETGMLEEDEVLQNFVVESTGGNIGANTGSHLVVAVEGEEKDVIYLALEQGIFRHVIGGTVMEQVADGALCSLGDPQMYLHSVAAFSDEEFMILYNDQRLYRYTYDPTMPAVPQEQLVVYSLEEDYTIRQAVSLYQKQNPGVYVRYEVGMSGNTGLTKEDAIKNLNTRLLSGNGPDLIVLDGLPAASYRQKGILADLTELEKGFTGENSLFPNLVDACRMDGGLYFLPVRFQIALLVGEKDALSQVTDLASLADAAEKIRKEHPEGGITGLPMEEMILVNLGYASCGAWTDEQGAIDEKALAEFLTQAKRIYQAEIAGYSEEELRFYQERKIAIYEEGNGVRDFYRSAGSQAISLGMGEARMVMGQLGDMKSDFNTITSVAEQKGDVDFMLCPGQVADGFLPVTQIGICAQSMEKEGVQSFFQFLFEGQLQDMDLSGGFPMNQASFEKLATDPKEGEEAGSISIGSSGENGEMFSLEIHWAKPEEFEQLKTIVESLKTACVSEAMIEETVYEAGVKVLDGSTSVESAVEEIVKKAAIYLAE